MALFTYLASAGEHALPIPTPRSHGPRRENQPDKPHVGVVDALPGPMQIRK